MQSPVVAVYYNGFKKAYPYVYDGVQWRQAVPMAYVNNNWTPIGAMGTLMIELKESTGQLFQTYDGHTMLVRQD